MVTPLAHKIKVRINASVPRTVSLIFLSLDILQMQNIICSQLLLDLHRLCEARNFKNDLSFQDLCTRPGFVQDGPSQFDIIPGKMGT